MIRALFVFWGVLAVATVLAFPLAYMGKWLEMQYGTVAGVMGAVAMVGVIAPLIVASMVWLENR